MKGKVRAYDRRDTINGDIIPFCFSDRKWGAMRALIGRNSLLGA